jgi:hypothetical protein
VFVQVAKHDDSITRTRVSESQLDSEVRFGSPIPQNICGMTDKTPKSFKYLGCPMGQTRQADTVICTCLAITFHLCYIPSIRMQPGFYE